MHIKIFNPNQVQILPLVKQFKREFYLAIALHIGHRRSIDFDLFKYSPIKPKSILQTISGFGSEYIVTRRVTEQLNVNVNNVKFTFYQFPFKINASERLEDILRLPNLLDLAAMKAYALSRRSKWKDYVDLYFILKEHFTVKQISERTTGLFGQLFPNKAQITNLRQQTSLSTGRRQLRTRNPGHKRSHANIQHQAGVVDNQ